jgi:hypothetical protein
MAFDNLAFNKMEFDNMSICLVDKLEFDNMAFNKMEFGNMAFDEIEFDNTYGIR